ncbi:alanine racemase [Tunturiibacter gelidoferens]|uniref:Alanine racemase n=1 Tax=Tunturiibacter lichenicola TaxID=2051959 RepID=A0A7Y9NIC8_9BACT|nr:alanine racemase [Edaphobacter lichenicola]
MKNWVEVSERRLAGNYRLLQGAAGAETAVLAVVKANAYGHGAAVCAPVLARAGAEWLGVTDVAEGAAVREALAGAGISRREQPEILVMSGLLREDVGDVIRHGLTPVVWLREQMEWLVEAAGQSGGVVMPVHVEIDTGMARQGVTPGEELEALLGWVKGQTALRVNGVMTHFASSEVAGSAQTVAQRKRFEEAMGAVAAAGLRPVWVHAGNSSTLDNQGGEGNVAWLRGLAAGVGAKSMVRTGIALYGYCLPIEGGGLNTVRRELQPVMTWKTRVIGVREVEAGETVGYNGIFVAERAMRLALLPVGYADGLRRELSASNARLGGWAMVRGQRAAIVGRVSMNLTVVDVSGIADVAVGDEVVVLGDGATADDHARLAGTIAYEIVCGVRAAHRCGIAG